MCNIISVPTKPVFVHRLEKLSSKPRPIRVIMPSPFDVIHILKIKRPVLYVDKFKIFEFRLKKHYNNLSCTLLLSLNLNCGKMLVKPIYLLRLLITVRRFQKSFNEPNNSK